MTSPQEIKQLCGLKQISNCSEHGLAPQRDETVYELPPDAARRAAVTSR